MRLAVGWLDDTNTHNLRTGRGIKGSGLLSHRRDSNICPKLQDKLVFDATGFLTARAVLSSEPQFNSEMVSHFDFPFLFRKRRRRRKTKTSKSDRYSVCHVDADKPRML